MERRTRRGYIGGLLSAGTISLSGCVSLDPERFLGREEKIKDTDEDGVIDSEDYAPRDPTVQEKPDIQSTESPTQTRTDSTQEDREPQPPISVKDFCDSAGPVSEDEFEAWLRARRVRRVKVVRDGDLTAAQIFSERGKPAGVLFPPDSANALLIETAGPGEEYRCDLGLQLEDVAILPLNSMEVRSQAEDLKAVSKRERERRLADLHPQASRVSQTEDDTYQVQFVSPGELVLILRGLRLLILILRCLPEAKPIESTPRFVRALLLCLARTDLQ